MRRTIKNRKNPKNRNKRPNLKLKGEPRFYDNHIEVDIELFRKNMKKSRKRNGGGDFSDGNCDATPLTEHISLDTIPQLNLLNLQQIGYTKEGLSNIVTISKCPISHANEFALRISRSSVSIEQLSVELHRQKFQSIIDEYNRQIELSRHNYTPKLFYVCFLHIEFIRKLLGPIHSITVGTTGEQYCLCSVMEKVQIIREVNIRLIFDVIHLVNDVVNNSQVLFIDIKPENIGYNSNGQIVFFDLETTYSCGLTELSPDYMSSMEEISSFCIFLMRYIFISFVIHKYDLSKDTDLSELIAIIQEINSKSFTLFGEPTPFLHVLAIMYILQDTEYRFFPKISLFKAIINTYIYDFAVKDKKKNIYKEDLKPFHDQDTIIPKILELLKKKESSQKGFISKLEEHKMASGR